MKQIKLICVSIALLLCCVEEVSSQAQKVMSGTITELIGKTAEPLVGVNVNIVNAQNRSPSNVWQYPTQKFRILY